jgi:hypothetical protein
MTNPNARSFTASVCALTVRLYHRGADWNWPQVEELYKITSIDKWFLYKLKRIVDVDTLIEVCRYEYSRTRRFHKAESFRASQRIMLAVCEMAGRGQPSHPGPHPLTRHVSPCAPIDRAAARATARVRPVS